MLQQVEYNPRKFGQWVLAVPGLHSIRQRGKLVMTNKAKALIAISYIIYIWLLSIFVYLVVTQQYPLAIIVFVLTPFFTALFLEFTAIVGSLALEAKRKPLMKQAQTIFQDHPGERIAVLGSYGKTSMKEILAIVLSEKFNVAMTPGNKNVPISHARWAKALNGDEDVLVIEYGEGEPGDIVRLATLSKPTKAVMTGVAPNHLDEYKTLNALVQDLASIEQFVKGDNLYVNADAKSVINALQGKARLYSNQHANGWDIADAKVLISGTSFVMKRGHVTMKLHSELLGEHNIGPLAAAASIAYEMGMSVGEIQAGIANTKAFEHRMQARQLHGAWLIDDTYNGNLEGFKAGLNLLSKLEAKRKIYVTPGLVDQGEETESVHKEIGEAIARANPDKVVLMKNPNTVFISKALEGAGYNGDLMIETSPLDFYNNLEHFVAAGDLVLMQNDLPDAYA